MIYEVINIENPFGTELLLKEVTQSSTFMKKKNDLKNNRTRITLILTDFHGFKSVYISLICVISGLFCVLRNISESTLKRYF